MNDVPSLPYASKNAVASPSATGRVLSALAPFLGLALVMILFYVIPPHPSVTKLDLQTV